MHRPFAEVQHCERLKRGPFPPRTTEPEPNSLFVITSKTRYDFESDHWSNPIYIPEDEAATFIEQWTEYLKDLGRQHETISNTPS